MKTSLLWLRDYVEIDVDPKEFANKMTMSGSKVETVEELAEGISGVVIGKILSIEKHPDADKLRVCQVDVGNETIQVVTNAQNVYEGAVVPVALAGAVLVDNFKIKKGKLRGVQSDGMFCSVEEFGMSVHDFPEAEEGAVHIFDTENSEIKITLGMDAKVALGIDQDIVDFEITPNRPDCLSVYGLALEAAATFGKSRKPLLPNVKAEGKGSALDMVKVDVQAKDLCTRFIARVVTDVKIGPSPKWMRDRLLGAGVRSINNIVDITNFVMLELGQPMHAYDARDVDGMHFNVRRAADGEKFITLDDQERILDSDMLMICDNSKAIGVAGVMGGQNSEIKDDTTTVIFEAAMFNGASVRTTAKKLGLRTEASGRFEKGLDVNNTLIAMERACELVEMLGCGVVVPDIVDVYPNPVEQSTVEFDSEYINKFLGTDIPAEQMIKYLKLLEFEPNAENANEVTSVKVPFARMDVKLKADIAEEVARLYDYNNIKPTLLDGKQTTLGEKTFKQQVEDTIIKTMNACGLSEIYTYSFGSPKTCDMLMMTQDDSRRKQVVISNPLGEDYSVMRTTLIGDMLNVLTKNMNKRIPKARLFEMGKVYLPVDGEKLPDERQTISIGMYGDCDFYTIKGVVEELFDALSIRNVKYLPQKNNPTFHVGRAADIIVGDVAVGIVGEIHPLVAKQYDTTERAYIAEIDLLPLFNTAKTLIKYKQLPKFPATSRDLAILVKQDVLVSQIDEIIKQKGGKLLEEANLFDVYKGAQVPEGMKSVAYSLLFRADDRTLTDEEVAACMDKIKKSLNNELGAELRA